MIAKKYRLKEREVKKVLQKGKPFFSYILVFKVFPHRLPYDRYAIVISKKSVINNVVRNRYRRHFYDMCSHYQDKVYGNIVCVVKTKHKLFPGSTYEEMFRKEIRYLFEKKLGKNI